MAASSTAVYNTYNTLNSKISNLFTIQTYKVTTDFEDATYVYGSVDVTLSGYTPLGIVGYWVGINTRCYLQHCYLSGTTAQVVLRNTLNVSWTASSGVGWQVYVLYKAN